MLASTCFIYFQPVPVFTPNASVLLDLNGVIHWLIIFNYSQRMYLVKIWLLWMQIRESSSVLMTHFFVIFLHYMHLLVQIWTELTTLNTLSENMLINFQIKEAKEGWMSFKWSLSCFCICCYSLRLKIEHKSSFIYREN